MSNNRKKQLIGQVVSNKMDKTVIVNVESRSPHPIYKKYVTKSKKYYVHDPKSECKPGDTVSIIECRPMSKLKRWRFHNIEQKSVQI